MRLIREYLQILVIVSCLTINANAQSQHANQSRGFDANGVYSTKAIDNINLFNGNLVLTIPIGGSYRVGGGFSYSLTLVYNSNLWNHKEICPVNISYKVPVWTTTDADGNIVISDPPNDSQEPPNPRSAKSGCYTITEPNPESNAGPGWRLSLGKLYPPRFEQTDNSPLKTEKQNWVYVAPDGSEHSFYSRLHQSDAVENGDSDPVTDPVTYTRDGTYLRMRIVGNDRHVEFPNGDVHIFRNHPSTETPIDWRLVTMQDRFGNSVNVSYFATEWVLTDSVGRTQKIFFQTKTADFPQVITEVRLAAFNNSTASYLFNYSNQYVERASPYVNDLPGFSSHLWLPFLTDITLPDSSKYSIPVSTSYDLDGSQSSSRLRGVIKGITLPTGARIEWDYSGTPGVPTVDDLGRRLWYGYPLCSSARGYSRSSIGVRRRRLIEGGNTYTWFYDPRPQPSSNPLSTDPIHAPREFVNKVTTPEGNYSLHYYSVFPFPLEADGGRSLSDWHLSEYGLPITKYRSVNGADSKPLFLSQEVFKAGAAESDPVRSIYLRYETDTVPANNGYGSVVDTNRRVVAQRTVFNDDDDMYAEVQYSQFDGLGHYRRKDFSGSFGVGDASTERTNYNPARGTYLVNPANNQPDTTQAAPWGHNYQSFPVNEPWVLFTFDNTVRVEDGLATRVYFSFSNTGLLLRKRVVKNTGANPALDPHDIVVEYDYANGNATSEKFYGGDKQWLDTTKSLATMSLTGAEYRIDHSYQYGTLKTSQYNDANGNPLADANFKVVDNDIDQQSGLVKTSRNAAKDPINYTYDGLGRVTDIKPRQGSWTHVDYEASNGTSIPKAKLYRKNGITGAILDQEEYWYDQMGRINVERKLMPDNTFMERVTKYNGSGWTISVSEWGNISKKTEYDLFDPFGRAQKVTPPDGSSHITWFNYSGVRQIKRTEKVGNTYSGGVVSETDAVTTENYDRLGRLNSVEEYSNNTTGQAVKTFYSYDVGNRLRLVSTTLSGTNPITQKREFTYDNRGFLVSEKHPELGPAGNGSIQLSNYNTQGLPGQKIDGVNTTRFTYDGTGRRKKVEERCIVAGACASSPDSNWRPLKEYEYYQDDPSAGGLYRLGKQRLATRHNYVVNPNSGALVDVTVTQTFDYWGVDGRMSHRSLSTSTGAAFEQTFSYDLLGNLAAETYPECKNATCTGSPQATLKRQLTYGYSKGMLTQVTGKRTDISSPTISYASSITYHPNGTVNTVTHGNGVSDVNDLDPDYMQRARRIATSGALLPGTSVSGDWNSNIYTYDGAGNIKKIGVDWYLYDKAKRVVEGTAMSVNKKQRFTYDIFGNITAIKTYGNPGTPNEPLINNYTINVDSATNRLNDISYDAQGNLLGTLASNPKPYAYDAFNQMTNSPHRTYLYDASDERVWIYDHYDDTDPTTPPNTASYKDTFVLRGLGNQVLREYEILGGNASGNWKWTKDYIYRGARLLASESSANGRLDYHVDHLGTPRLITNTSRHRVSYHQYFPFGEEATSSQQNTERLKFTGHERDVNYAPGHTLDYMHARFYGTYQAKFLSVDPGRDFDLHAPQSWNLYAYVRGNAINAHDPTGRFGNMVSLAMNLMVVSQDYIEATVPVNPITNTPGVNPAESGVTGQIRPGEQGRGLFRSRTGKKHEAIDIAAPNGTDVHAAMSGEVVANREVPGYGWVVVIKHADGTRTLYAHLQQKSTASGWVKRGTVIGKAGSTGNADDLPVTEQHLHFGYKETNVTFKKHEKFSDPLEFLNRSLIKAFDTLRTMPF